MVFISVSPQIISQEDLSIIVHYGLSYLNFFICCFIGTFIKDAIYSYKNKLKIDLISILLYDIPCAFIMTAVSDLFKTKFEFSMWEFVSVFAGMWSREIVSVLMNSKFVSFAARLIFGKALNSTKDNLTDEEKENLTNIFQSAISTTIEADKKKDIKNRQDPVGEFDWIDILEK